MSVNGSFNRGGSKSKLPVNNLAEHLARFRQSKKENLNRKRPQEGRIRSVKYIMVKKSCGQTNDQFNTTTDKR